MKKTTWEPTKLTKKDFEFVNWTSAEIKKLPDAYKKHKVQVYKEIKSIKPEERTFENTILAVEYSDGEYINDLYKASVLSMVSPDKKIRKTCVDTVEKLEKFSVDIEYDKGIYKAITETNLMRKDLDSEDKKLLEDYIKAYKRMGFNLSDKKQLELKKISKRVAILELKFSENIDNYSDFITISESETEGLDDDFLKTLSRDKKGRYIITLDYPNYYPFMENSKNENKRKELERKDQRKGGKKNIEYLNEATKLKKRKAQLLGYETHAGFVLENKMAKNPKNVYKFLNSLDKKTAKILAKDMKSLKNEKRNDIDAEDKEKFHLHDLRHYESLLKNQEINIDQEELRKYFPLSHVKEVMFDTFGYIFGVEFKKEKIIAWQKDVETFSVIDKKTENNIAYINMDLFPRDGKYGHACNLTYRSGMLSESNKHYILPVSAIICNFRKPTKNAPSLLSIREIETLFHEFGHTLHSCLTKAKYSAHSGTSVAGDFVETPSQLMENFFFDQKILKKLSNHYKTGKSLPKTKIDKIIKSKNFLSSLIFVRTLNFSLLDMEINHKQELNPIKFYKNRILKTYNISVPQDTLFPASLNHLMGGYDAGYYGYLWSLVYSDDIFSEFQKHGIFSKKIGMKYRKEILEVGSSRDEMESLKAFLGRKPNNKAFLKNIGVK